MTKTKPMNQEKKPEKNPDSPEESLGLSWQDIVLANFFA
jgi:hypothetical protein